MDDLGGYSTERLTSVTMKKAQHMMMHAPVSTFIELAIIVIVMYIIIFV